MSAYTREGPIRRIVIAGGNTASWMSAAALAHTLGALPGVAITLVESEAIGTVGVGEATIPQIIYFNRMLGLDEGEFLRETHGTYKLGIEFVDWRRRGHSYIHPFGFYGIDMLGVDFHHFWLRGQALGDSSALDDYAICAGAAHTGRFMAPAPDQPNSPLARLGYAYQFDAGRYAAFLRRFAEARGVVRHEGRIAKVEQDGESGFVTALALEDGRSIEGDLFIDCTGFRSLLLGEAMGSPFTDWSRWLPCDRAVAVPCAHAPGHTLGADLPLTRSTARGAGWQWRIPLQHRVGNGHVFASAFMEQQEAEDILLANLGGKPLGDLNRIRFAAGHRAQGWVRNVVGIGLAGGFLEPLESTSIHLIQSGIARLLSLFPTRAFTPAEIDRYNFETAREYADIRDFLILHYCTTERDDTPFWRYCQTMDLPDGPKEKLAMFRSSGRIFREHEELFTETSWLSVMVGQGVQAGGWHPVAGALPDGEVLHRLAHIRDAIAQTVQAMPRQNQWLAHIGGAISPAQVPA